MSLKSPLRWVGGKFYSRERILSAFPPPERYSTYVEVFGGAAHVLLHKPPYHHLEIYNDRSDDLINFWMQCRNHPEELQRQIDTLPYARSLYETWQESLFDGSPMSDMERAVRWFYVLCSALGGQVRKTGGNWGYQIKRTDFGDDQPNNIHRAIERFHALSERLKRVQIECDDFATIITRYDRPTTFFYCDPPYIGVESYYSGVPSFTLADHERLAALLNNVQGRVMLSYYPHEQVDERYPASRWRRVSWQTYKHAERTTGKRQTATELLLLNYEEPSMTLWDMTDSEVSV